MLDFKNTIITTFTFNEKQLFKDIFEQLGYKYINKDPFNVRYFKKTGMQVFLRAQEINRDIRFNIEFDGHFSMIECNKLIEKVRDNLVSVCYQKPFWNMKKEKAEMEVWIEEFNEDKFERYDLYGG